MNFMNHLFLLMAGGQQGANGQAQGGSGWTMLIFFVAIILVFWLFMIRPQQKKQKEIQNFRNSIEKGQEIITAGGIYGVVRDIDEVKNVLIVEVANGVRLRVDRNSVFASAASTEVYNK